VAILQTRLANPRAGSAGLNLDAKVQLRGTFTFVVKSAGAAKRDHPFYIGGRDPAVSLGLERPLAHIQAVA
jgi:hypothetical protein